VTLKPYKWQKELDFVVYRLTQELQRVILIFYPSFISDRHKPIAKLGADEETNPKSLFVQKTHFSREIRLNPWFINKIKQNNQSQIIERYLAKAIEHFKLFSMPASSLFHEVPKLQPSTISTQIME